MEVDFGKAESLLGEASDTSSTAEAVDRYKTTTLIANAVLKTP